MSGMCPVCMAQQDAGLLCSACCDRLERELGDVAALVHELDIAVSKQARIGNAGPGGLARERTPVNWGAAAVAGDLQDTLTTWARDVARESADCTCGHGELPAHFHMTPCPIKVAHLARISLDRPIVTNPASAGARILLNSIDAIRRHPAVVELVDEVTDAIAQARRVVDRPADRIYLGQCLMVTPDEQGRDVTCLEEIWARPGAHETTCRVCGVTHEVVERRAWLLQKCKDYLFTVKDASEMLGEVGHITVTQASIRGYIHRGKIGYRSGNTIRLGDLLEVVLDESERRTA